MRLDKCVVAVKSWQMQCCGEPFKVGDIIDWTVIEDKCPIEESEDMTDYYYENHDVSHSPESVYKITGTVDSIMARYFKRKRETIPHPHHKPGLPKYIKGIVRYYTKSVNVTKADGFDKKIGRLHFEEYIVTLSDCVVEPKYQNK